MQENEKIREGPLEAAEGTKKKRKYTRKATSPVNQPQASKASTKASTRRFDGNSKAKRLAGWITPAADANASMYGSKTLLNRAHDLARNNCYACNAIAGLVGALISTGILTSFKGKSKNRTKQINAEFKKWAESRKCDADGVNNLYGLQELAVRSMIEGGQSFIRLRITNERNLVPISLQILEGELLASEAVGFTYQELPNGNIIERGIEHNKEGQRVAYHFYKRHPDAQFPYPQGMLTQVIRIPADEIIHLYRKNRPGQQTGISWLAPVIVPLRNLQLFLDGSISKQQLASFFAGFIYSDNPTASTVDDLETELPELSPGTITELPNGKKITFTDPPKIDKEYADFIKVCLREIASGFGIPYELLDTDYSDVNFSSARMAFNSFYQKMDMIQWNLIIPTMCDQISEWFLKVWSLKTGLQVDDIEVSHTPAGRVLVDESKEIPVIIEKIKAGLLSLPEAQRILGYDSDALMQQLKDTQAILDAEGIVVSSDYRNELKLKEKKNG